MYTRTEIYLLGAAITGLVWVAADAWVRFGASWVQGIEAHGRADATVDTAGGSTVAGERRSDQVPSAGRSGLLRTGHPRAMADADVKDTARDGVPRSAAPAPRGADRDPNRARRRSNGGENGEGSEQGMFSQAEPEEPRGPVAIRAGVPLPARLATLRTRARPVEKPEHRLASLDEMLAETRLRDRLQGQLQLGMTGLRQCYNDALRGDPRLRGTIHFTVSVDAGGHVGGVKVDQDTIGDPGLRRCAARRLRRPLGGIDRDVEVSFPVVFRAT